MPYGACATCQFCADPGDGQHECTRHPPQVVVINEYQAHPIIQRSVWPHVTTTSGCGEYRKNGQEAEAQPVSIASIPDLVLISTPTIDFGGTTLDINVVSGGGL